MFESVHYRLHINGKILNLISAYRTPCLDENAFLNYLEHQLLNIDVSEPCIVSGDLNFDLLSARGNRLQHFAKRGSLHLVDDTKLTGQVSGTILDVLMTNQPSIITEHHVEPCPFSDHSAVICALTIKCHIESGDIVTLRRLSDAVIAQIDGEFRKTSFVFLNTITNVNDRWLMLKQMLLSIINNHALMKKLRLKSKSLPWLDADTFKLKHYRDKL